MHNRKIALLLCLVLILIAGCRQETTAPTSVPAGESDSGGNVPNEATLEAARNEISISLGVMPAPIEVGESTLLIAVTNGFIDPLPVSRITVRGDMNHAGMVPVIVESTEGESGQFELPFEWTMGGDWIVEVTAELTDGRSHTQTFEFSVGGDDGEHEEHGEHEEEATAEAED